MPIKKKDSEFRIPKVSYFHWNHTEMDRVLTMLFPRLLFDGYGSRKPARTSLLQPEQFVEEMLLRDTYFHNFEKYKSIVEKWVETDLLDLVNRGRANQVVAAPRPLHGATYKFRNTKHCRDYGTAEQIYWMLHFSRHGLGDRVCKDLKQFFFKGIDLTTQKSEKYADVDVETQTLLRFNEQVGDSLKESTVPEKYEPLCMGRSDIMAEDIQKLLVYEPYIPRTVMVDYLKTLMAFHLALYHFALLKVLPASIKQKCRKELCGKRNCPVKPGSDVPLKDCPYRIALIVDMGYPHNQRMTDLAGFSAERLYRQIPAFVQANYTVKKLDEMADYLCKKNSPLVPSNGTFSVGDLINMLNSEYDTERDAYFKSRIAGIVDEEDREDMDPEIRDVMKLKLPDFDSFIEILMAYRGKYHQQYITECFDSLLLKNKENGLLVQSRSKGSQRRFFMGSKLLEVLLQIAVLKVENGQFVTGSIRIEELLTLFRNRYDIYIDKLPQDSESDNSIYDQRALRLNTEAFKRRLREIGFYEDLSDAYVTQKISPRYIINSENSNG
ncbi:hypothetical protein AGMMS49940_22640 [Spirochaetia bacterium]|nr:hypothetical protein AGMMS49940_22640 [Spirochaetia bacterium]